MQISKSLKTELRKQTKRLGMTQKEYIEHALVHFTMLTSFEENLQKELQAWRQASTASDFMSKHKL